MAKNDKSLKIIPPPDGVGITFEVDGEARHIAVSFYQATWTGDDGTGQSFARYVAVTRHNDNRSYGEGHGWDMALAELLHRLVADGVIPTCPGASMHAPRR